MEKGKKVAADKAIDVMRNLADKAAAVTEEARKLEEVVRLARGTRDGITHPSPAGQYFVGDEGPTPELLATVRRMLQERPMTLQDLLDATGARPNRIKGVLMRIQRDEDVDWELVNLGTETRAIWFLASRAVLVRLLKARRLRRRVE